MNTRLKLENTSNKMIQGEWEYFNEKQKSTRYPLKLNTRLQTEHGILSIAYRNKCLTTPPDEPSFALGSRHFTFYNFTRLECNIHWMQDDFDQDTDNLSTLLNNIDAVYLVANNGLFFIKKSDGNPKITLLHPPSSELNKLRNNLQEKSRLFNQKTSSCILYEKPATNDLPLKWINSMTKHNLNDHPVPVKQKKILAWLVNKYSKNIFYNENHCIINSARREEVFFPVGLDIADSKTGFYIYPWSSSGAQPAEPYQSFSTYVTAGCMFGSYLKGSDLKYGNKKPLIKHDIKFTGQEKISDVACEVDNVNPYEEIVFWDFEKLLRFIQASSQSKNQVKIIYHLPSVDYMLFGLKLFFHGRMTLCVLNSLFSEIIREKKIYEDRLNEIVNTLELQNKIELDIQSPFSSLLKLMDNSDPQQLASTLLTKLKLSTNEIDFSECTEDQRCKIGMESEKKLVEACRKFLLNNENSSGQPRTVSEMTWESLLRADDAIRIRSAKEKQEREKNLPNNTNPVNESPIEDFLTLGNTIMPTIAAYQKNPNTVCSFLPISEKQIQNSYQLYHKQMEKDETTKGKYASVINLTCLDSVLAYGPQQDNTVNHSIGLAFYFDHPLPAELNHGLRDQLKRTSDLLYTVAASHSSRLSHPVNEETKHYSPRMFQPPFHPAQVPLPSEQVCRDAKII